MPKCFAVSRFALSLLGLFFLIFCNLAAAPYGAAGAQNQRQVVRAVSLGAATLSPTTIPVDGEPATVTVTVTTSPDVLAGTVAVIDLTEESNTDEVSYTVTGGSGNGRKWNVILRGGGETETIEYKVQGTGSGPLGKVKMRVTLRSVTNPPGAELPEAIIKAPTRLSQNLLLTFTNPPDGEGWN
jgi:hypothetical protein